ncbi:MAG TPA: glycosyltransferase family 1 protein [Burkholderiaceae bacterium]|nr:glycosyltransferase family 1 protein [Burkholderiaceae bacterium]
MRIAFVTETFPPEVNGVALTVERSVRHMRRAGHDVLLVRPRQSGEGGERSAAQCLTAGMRIPMYPQLRVGLATSGSLRRCLGRFGADLVHVATQGPLGHAALAAASRLGLPVTSDFRTNFHVYCQHYGLGFARDWVVRYLRGFHNRAAATFVPCRLLRNELLAQGFERVEVLGRGVDSRLFSPQRRDDVLRLRWGAGRDNPVLLYVGRLASEKNVPLALEAFAAVRARVPQARMVVVGDGPQLDTLRASHPNVHFAGLQRGEALAAHYASADVFVFPSLSETFGNVTLEAMASGLCVVAFAAAAAGELVRHGRNGLLVPPGHRAAFVRTVCIAAHGRTDLGGLRQQARRTALASDWEPVLQRFEARLCELSSTMDVLGHASLA